MNTMPPLCRGDMVCYVGKEPNNLAGDTGIVKEIYRGDGDSRYYVVYFNKHYTYNCKEEYLVRLTPIGEYIAKTKFFLDSYAHIYSPQT